MLLGACAFFALVGVTLALAGGAVFGLWRELVSSAIWDGPMPASVVPFAELTDGILGGSIVGKWVASAWLVHEPLRRRERWGLRVLLFSHVGWFVIDSTASILYGAAINVAIINLFPLVLVGGLALAMWRHTVEIDGDPRPRPRSVLLLTLVCAMSIVVGLACAFAIRSPLFALYEQGIADTYFASEISATWIPWERFAYGLIGGAIAGHFIALTGALLRAPNERWVYLAVLTSMLAWFGVDTTMSIVHGAWFNVLQVNLPSLLATLAPLLFALRREAESELGVSSS